MFPWRRVKRLLKFGPSLGIQIEMPSIGQTLLCPQQCAFEHELGNGLAIGLRRELKRPLCFKGEAQIEFFAPGRAFGACWHLQCPFVGFDY